jgi:pimeloyl-ACP methyl ester carboxylesterase
MPKGALCGTYEVFENRATRTGRKIPLRVLVLPATGPDRLPDPYIYFAGGPGEPSIPAIRFLTQKLGSLRLKRDVLLLDLRGTGKSGGLFCPELKEKESAQGFLDDFMPVDKVHACLDRLKKEVDLSWYTTDAAVDDVEEVRTALGYGQLNLIGGSYGTRTVQTYLRRHPRSVRTATMHGIVAPDRPLLLDMPGNAQKALDGLIAECEGDPACRGAYPKLRQEVGAVLSRVTKEPVRVELTDPATGQPTEVRLSQNGLAQSLRYMLYSPVEAASLPLKVHLAAQGDWKPLAWSAQIHGSIMSMMAEGLYQSVTCAEDVPFVRDGEVAAAVAGTFLGDFRIRRQKAACQGWPTRDLGSDLRSPVVSDVPALLISGERDPASPVSNGERVARGLKRSRHLIIPDGSHYNDEMQGSDCVNGLIAAFIEAGSAEGLDTSCVARVRRPDFELPGVTLAKADLEGLTGSYTYPEMELAIKIDLEGTRLRLSFTQGPPFPPALLTPTSPTRFRWEGEGVAPGLYVVFQVTEGKATTMTVVQPGKPELVMKRAE